jgi:hypothetical protein
MKCEVINLISSKLDLEVMLEHEGEQLTFSVAKFGRPSFDKFDTFAEINAYWAQLPELEQAKIFALYREIAFLFATVNNRNTLKLLLTPKVTQLLDAQNYNRLYDWILYRAPITIPEHLEETYVESIDKNGSRRQTYTRSDYTRLVTLAVLLRCMVPVWGEFIDYVRESIGTLLKEYYAFQLIEESPLLEHESFKKLREYVNATIGEDRENAAAIVEWISSEELPDWMLALVVIRRVCIGDVRGTQQRANIVPYIYKYIVDKLKGEDNVGENAIKKKLHDAKGGELEEKLSVFERYKIKQEIPIGDVAELDHIVRDPYEVATKLCPEIPEWLLIQSLESSKRLTDVRILDPQIILLQWLLKPLLSPRGIKYLNKPTIVRCLGVAQAVLWAKGHKYLALVVTSYADLSSQEFFIGGADSRSQITKELHAELNHLYPFQPIPTGKKQDPKPINLAVKSIEHLASLLTRLAWTMTAPEDFITEVFGPGIIRKHELPMSPDIKNHLAQLVLDLGKRQA